MSCGAREASLGIEWYLRETERFGENLMLPAGRGVGLLRAGGRLTGMKKLMILVVVVLLGGFAVWRKVQSQRADLDLWSEATTADN
jgi:hypothetical protein